MLWLVCILSVLIPVSVAVTGYFFHLNTKSFLNHMSDTMTIGGQPKDLMVRSAEHRMTQDAARQEAANDRRKSFTMEKLVS